MILDKEIKVNVSSRVLSYYNKLGYINAIKNKLLTIDVNHLSNCSREKINVKCDVCDCEKMISYAKYIKNTKNLTEKYCCSNSCAHISNKNKRTNLLFHSNENYRNGDKIRETKNNKSEEEKRQATTKLKLKKLQIYGDENFNNHEKSKQTCLNIYGVENPMQSQKIFEKNQLSGRRIKIHEQTGLKYQGTYEKHFLDYCCKHNILVEKPKSIRYKFDGKNRIYHPDFYLPNVNLIVEIKSDYYYNKYLKKNLSKHEACIKQEYNHIFIINKKYDEFNILINLNGK